MEKCKINNAIKNYDKTKRCVIYKLDVDKGGIFHDAGKMDMVDDDETLWELLKNDNVGSFFFWWWLKVIIPLYSKIRT